MKKKTKKQKQDICEGDRVILSAPQCEPVEMTVIKVLAGGKTIQVRPDNSTGAVPDFYATREMCKKV
jgi:hypothetical protein